MDINFRPYFPGLDKKGSIVNIQKNGLLFCFGLEKPSRS
jgi:hypothetical protein